MSAFFQCGQHRGVGAKNPITRLAHYNLSAVNRISDSPLGETTTAYKLKAQLKLIPRGITSVGYFQELYPFRYTFLENPSI